MMSVIGSGVSQFSRQLLTHSCRSFLLNNPNNLVPIDIWQCDFVIYQGRTIPDPHPGNTHNSSRRVKRGSSVLPSPIDKSYPILLHWLHKSPSWAACMKVTEWYMESKEGSDLALWRPTTNRIWCTTYMSVWVMELVSPFLSLCILFDPFMQQLNHR